MASPTSDIGTGASITFSGWTASASSISMSGMERAEIDTTHLKTTLATADVGSKTYIPGKYASAGTIQATCHFNPDAVPPIESAAAALTITFGSGATWACTAFVTSFSWEAPLEELMTCQITWRIAGAVNATAAV